MYSNPDEIHEAWYWPKRILRIGWLCITSRPVLWGRCGSLIAHEQLTCRTQNKKLQNVSFICSKKCWKKNDYLVCEGQYLSILAFLGSLILTDFRQGGYWPAGRVQYFSAEVPLIWTSGGGLLGRNQTRARTWWVYLYPTSYAIALARKQVGFNCVQGKLGFTPWHIVCCENHTCRWGMFTGQMVKWSKQHK